MTRLPSVAYAASSAAITDGLPPAVCLLASRLAFAYKQSTGLFASQLSLREGSQGPHSLRELHPRAVVVIATLITGAVFAVEDFGHQSAQTQNDAQPEENIEQRA